MSGHALEEMVGREAGVGQPDPGATSLLGSPVTSKDQIKGRSSKPEPISSCDHFYMASWKVPDRTELLCSQGRDRPKPCGKEGNVASPGLRSLSLRNEGWPCPCGIPSLASWLTVPAEKPCPGMPEF